MIQRIEFILAISGAFQFREVWITLTTHKIEVRPIKLYIEAIPQENDSTRILHTAGQPKPQLIYFNRIMPFGHSAV